MGCDRDSEAVGEPLLEGLAPCFDFVPLLFPFMPCSMAAKGRNGAETEWLVGRCRNSSMASAAASVVFSEYVTTKLEGGGVSADEVDTVLSLSCK